MWFAGLPSLLKLYFIRRGAASGHCRSAAPEMAAPDPAFEKLRGEAPGYPMPTWSALRGEMPDWASVTAQYGG